MRIEIASESQKKEEVRKLVSWISLILHYENLFLGKKDPAFKTQTDIKKIVTLIAPDSKKIKMIFPKKIKILADEKRLQSGLLLLLEELGGNKGRLILGWKNTSKSLTLKIEGEIPKKTNESWLQLLKKDPMDCALRWKTAWILLKASGARIEGV